jgi:DNA-binding FadR family transcriptional regulator
MDGMRAVLDKIDTALIDGTSTHELDYKFHCLIARASGNPYFLSFLEHFGAVVIPRRSIEIKDEDVPRDYLARSQAEHRSVLLAIEAQDGLRAARGMRLHISNGIHRYKSLPPNAG